MAKDLPYFKFNISEWLTGDITTCSLEAQGLFTNICALYWSREGDLRTSIIEKKFSRVDLMEELIEMGVIKLKDDQMAVSISFLDEQLEERKDLSSKNSKNVAKRWQKGGSDTTVLPPENVGNTKSYNKEERRGEEKREDKKRTVYANPFGDVWERDVKPHWEEFLEFRKEIKEPVVSDRNKHLLINELYSLSVGDPTVAEYIIKQSITKGWKGFYEPKGPVKKKQAPGAMPVSQDEYFREFNQLEGRS